MNILQLSNAITLLPVIHGSGDFALEVRRRILTGTYDCVAIPLPTDFEGRSRGSDRTPPPAYTL